MTEPTVELEKAESLDDGSVKFAIEEYKALWDYYKRTLEEREITLNYYFRTVTIPSAALATFTVLRVRQQSGTESLIFNISPSTIAAVLLVITLVGIACLLKYHLEAVNARTYIRALNRVRAFFREKFPNLDGYLIIDRTLPGKRPVFLRIPFYGSAIIALINSAILSATVELLITISLIYIAIFFASALVAQLLFAEAVGKWFVAAGEK
jgi:hypothetical protein